MPVNELECDLKVAPDCPEQGQFFFFYPNWDSPDKKKACGRCLFTLARAEYARLHSGEQATE